MASYCRYLISYYILYLNTYILHADCGKWPTWKKLVCHSWFDNPLLLGEAKGALAPPWGKKHVVPWPNEQIFAYICGITFTLFNGDRLNIYYRDGTYLTIKPSCKKAPRFIAHKPEHV